MHHRRATEWLRDHARSSWASCPITENGSVRIMAQPAYPNAPPVAAVIARLGAATRHPSHAFWPDDISLLDDASAEAERLVRARHVTDVYLLALAVKHSGRLVTFDGGIPLQAVQGVAAKHLVSI